MLYQDRLQAADQLVPALTAFRDQDAVVLGLPRGGVPLAAAVAEQLALPLDVIVVRKLGVPFQPELAMGAVGEDGVRVLNERVLRSTGVREPEVDRATHREQREVEDRATRFREGRPRQPLTGRVAILVDDGVATGSTMRAACQVARAQGAARIVVAVPVASEDAVQLLSKDADEVVCLATPRPFWSVGQWYDDFSPVEDATVVDLLRQAAGRPDRAADPEQSARAGGPLDEEVVTVADGARLPGHLVVPADALGLVVFAHGSGSSRHSPRNRYVAGVLNDAGIGTLLVDLLSEREEVSRPNVFDIDLLASRLRGISAWVRSRPDLEPLALGYFGASTGAAAALAAAATSPGVRAVVSRGGRPDLAGDHLTAVRAPTLLIVGSHDELVLELNRRAQRRLRCVNELAVVPGATHLFEEPGTLAAAAGLARDWFATHLVGQAAGTSG